MDRSPRPDAAARARHALAALAALDLWAGMRPELVNPGATGPDNIAAWKAALRSPSLEDALTDPAPRGGRPTNEEPIGTQVRLPGDLLARAEALRAAVRATMPELLAAGAVSRSTVIRLALIRGLDALERDCNADAR